MKAHHLELQSEQLAGHTVLLPGSPDRAARIAERLTGVQAVDNRRRLTCYLGRLGDHAVAAVPTGMGCPSVDIVVNELVDVGARRLLRVGTAGSLQGEVLLGDLVIATAAVRDEGTSDAYVPREFPAVSDPAWVQALRVAAGRLGASDRVHCGIVHSKDSFFGREFARGPAAERNQRYMAQLVASGVLATEMEAAHLFVLGSVLGLQTGAICAVVGSPEEGFASLADEQAAEERLIDVALAAVAELETA